MQWHELATVLGLRPTHPSPGPAFSLKHLVALMVKSRYRCRRHKRCKYDPWVGKILWRRARQPTPVFLPGKSHGQRSLMSYGPWCHKESNTTEAT